MPAIRDDKQGGLVRAATPASLARVKTKAPHGTPAPSPISGPPAPGRSAPLPPPVPAPKPTPASKGPSLASLKAAYRAQKTTRADGEPIKFSTSKLQGMGLVPKVTSGPHFDKHGRWVPDNGFMFKNTSDLMNIVAGIPAIPFVVGKAAYQDAQALDRNRPREATHLYNRVAKPVYNSFKDSAEHPLRHPVYTAANLLAVISGGAGAVARTGGAIAAAGDASGALGKSVASVKGFAKAPRGQPIVLKVPGKDGRISEVRVPRSRNQARNLVKRYRVARSNQQLAARTDPSATFSGGVRSSFGTAEHNVGRALRRQNELHAQMLEAPANGLDKFHRKLGLLNPLNRSTLSDPEQVAADIASTHGTSIVGDAPKVKEAVMAHRLYHSLAAEQAAKEQAHIAGLQQDLHAALEQGDEAAARKAAVRLQRAPRAHGLPADHEAKVTLARLAEPHLMNPKPRLQQALKQLPRVVELREQTAEGLGKLDRAGNEVSRLDETRQLHRLGARHAELTYGAKGIETPLQELARHGKDQADLEALRKTKTGAKVEQLQKLLERVQRVRAKRGGPQHVKELEALQAELDGFARKYGPHIRVLGAKRVNDALQEAMPASRRFIAGAGDEQAVVESHAGRTVPHTLETAEETHAKMARAYEDVFGRFVLGKAYKPGLKGGLRQQFGLTGSELEDQRWRNTNNGIIAKTKGGTVPTPGGSKALRVGHLGMVKDEKLAVLEKQMHDLLKGAAAKGDETAQGILDHFDKMLELEHGIAAVREHAAFGGEATDEVLAQHLGNRELPGPVTRQEPRASGTTIEETRPRPDLSIGKVRSAEAGSARAGAKLEGYRVLDQQEQMIKDELNKLVTPRKGGGEKAGGRMLRLIASEDARTGRVADIHDDLITSGRLLRDQGAFYLPSRDLSDVKRASSAAINPSTHGFGPGNQTLASLDKEYRAGYERLGRNRTDATRLAQEAYRETNKLAALDRGFKTLHAMSKDTIDEAGGPHYAVPIRATTAIPPELRRQLARVRFSGVTREEAQTLPPHELDALREWLFPHPSGVDKSSNLTRDGVQVRWVDSRIAGSFARRSMRGVHVGTIRGKEFGIGDMADAVNNPLRAGLLYTKPAYAINLVQGLGTNLLSQGVFLPSNIAHAFRLGRELGWEDQHRIFAAVGEGSAHALSADGATSWLGESVKNASDFWNVIVDRLPRVTQFLHEARRAGYKTPDQLHNLLHDPAHHDDLIELVDTANREAIDYSMTPAERVALRRVFFFYPWIRGATVWSMRFPLEHPLQSAAFAPLAEEGHADTVKALGQLPSYADALIHEGGLTMNLGNVNNFQTAKDVVQGVGGLAAGGSPDAGRLAGELGPVAGSLYTLASGKTSLGHDLPVKTSRLRGALQSLYQGLPAYQLAHRAMQPATDPHTNPSKQRGYEGGGPGYAIARWAAGSALPLQVNKPALNSKAETEKITQMGSRNAAIYHAGLAYEQVDKEFEKVAKILPAEFDQHDREAYKQSLLGAVDTQRELDTHLRDYASAKGVSTAELTGQQKLGVVLNVLEHRGLISPEIAQQEMTVLKSLPQQYLEDTAAKQAEQLRHGAGGGAIIAGWKNLLGQAHITYAGGG